VTAITHCDGPDWRRSRISAVFQASSRRDSRNHEVICVIRRKTNRRHMIEEYARHIGHADFLREQIDGAAGE
jgi:hypothetical protein